MQILEEEERNRLNLGKLHNPLHEYTWRPLPYSANIEGSGISQCKYENGRNGGSREGIGYTELCSKHGGTAWVINVGDYQCASVFGNWNSLWYQCCCITDQN